MVYLNLWTEFPPWSKNCIAGSCRGEQGQDVQVSEGTRSSAEQPEKHYSQAEQERPGPTEPSPTHDLSIEPRHLLVGISLGWIEPHLDTAAAPSVVLADLVGVTPDFIAQSSRRGEIEMEGVASSSHWAMIRPCKRMEDL